MPNKPVKPQTAYLGFHFLAFKITSRVALTRRTLLRTYDTIGYYGKFKGKKNRKPST